MATVWLPTNRDGSTRTANSNRNWAAWQLNSAQSKAARSEVQAPPECSSAFTCVPSTAYQLPSSGTRYSPMNPG